MTSTYTSSLRYEKPANGDYFGSWDVYLDRMMNIVDDATAGITTITACDRSWGAAGQPTRRPASELGPASIRSTSTRSPIAA